MSDRTKRQRLVFPGDKLRRLLEEHGMSQESFADLLGVSRVTVNQIINRRRSITADLALRLAQVTRTRPEEWLDLQQRVDISAARKRVARQLTDLPVLLKRHT